MNTPHILGSYTFDWNPDTMDIPEKEKTIKTVQTYTGAATFQWPAIIQGVTVKMTWRFMSIEQYNALQTLYLSSDVVTWNPQYEHTYQVIVSKFSGKYMKVSLDDMPYREKIKMELVIRSRS